jgi:tetratricopeptide (TPR) repeat protein
MQTVYTTTRTRRSLFLALVALTVLAGVGATRAGPIKITDLDLPADKARDSKVEELDQAVQSFEKRDYERCLKLLAAAGKKLPDLFPPRVILAKLHLLSNQTAEARAALEQATAEYPEHPENYLLFGKLALQEGRTTDAAVHFDKATALADGDKWNADVKQRLRGEALMGLADVAERRKDKKAAEAALSAALKLDPKNGKARERLGMILFRQGQRERAREELQQACKDDPKLDAAAVTMGRLYNESGDLKEAEKWLEFAAGGGGLRAHLVYADWLLAQARPQEAKKQAEAAAKVDPDSGDVRFLRGLIAWHLRDFAEAEKMFLAMHVESPGNFSASNNLASALVEQADEAKRRRGLELAQINARLYATSGEALSTLGRACYRNGRLEEAEQALRASIATGSASSDTAYYLAQVLSERGRTEEVKTLLKVALDAPGLFTFRKEARELADQLAKKP